MSIQFSQVRALIVSGLIAASASLALAASQASEPANNAAATRAQLTQHYGKIPLSFEANQGQAGKSVKFLSQGSGYSLFLTDASAVLALSKPDASNAHPASALKAAKTGSRKTGPGRTDIVRMDLAGANRGMRVTGSDPLPGTANYFIGNDPAKWHSGVPTFAKVKYTDVYPGIDLVYYGIQRQLECDFVVAPGADPKPIRLQFVGAKRVDLTADGNLTVAAANGEIAFHKPVVYQVKAGERLPIYGKFAMLANDTIGFTLGRYDHSKPLVIDPVLSYSTYLGGSLADAAYGIAVDSSGNAYVVGTNFSANFPVTTGAFQSANNEPANFQCIFVSKLNPAGTALVYSTYLGGSGNPGDHSLSGDVGQGIAVDGSGDAYVTGVAESTNFPVTMGAFQTVNNSTNAYTENGFVTKLNPAGTALVYSTYLGGGFEDSGNGIAVDGSGDAYVTGNAYSANFPVTAGAYQVINHASTSWYNAFVTKLNPTGTALVYSTYLGGSSYGSEGKGIAVDGSGDAYVTGSAASTDFPITNGAFQNTNFAAAAAGLQAVAYNVFVSKLNPTGTALVYSTFLGGSIDDYGAAIALDGSGDAYVTGQSWSSDFPVAGSPFQSANNAYANDGPNAFVTEVNSAGTGLVYSTFLGGTGIPSQGSNESGSGDSASAIAVDSLGDAYVTGTAISSNFPTTSGAYQTVNNAAGFPRTKSFIGVNAFITKLNPGGSTLLYSTYLGGSSQDNGYGIALDGVGGVYVAGEAESTDFPTTTGSYQPASAGGYSDAFIAKLAIGSVSTTGPVITAQPQSQAIASGGTVVFTVTAGGSVQSSVRSGAIFQPAATGATTYQWQFNGANLTDGGGISGSTGPQLVIQGATAANDGSYVCIVTAGGASTPSNAAVLSVTTSSNPGLATSISTRAFVGTGDNILIGGFYIVGSTSRTVLVQGLGPALTPLGVTGALQHPTVSIHQTRNGSDVTLYSNTGWGSSQVVLNAAASVFASPVLSPNSADSELLLTLPPGGYSAEVSGADGGTGVALCAIYELP